MSERHLVSVLLPVPVDRPYTYTSDRPLAPGSIVAAPLGPRIVTGTVWSQEPDELPATKMREIEGIYDAPPLPEELMRFVDWVAQYTLSPRGMVLRMVLRSPGALQPERPISGVRLAGPPPERMTRARQRILEHAADGLAWSKHGLARAAGVSPGVVEGLVAQGTLQVVPLASRPIAADPHPDHARPELSAEQERAAAALRATSGRGF